MALHSEEKELDVFPEGSRLVLTRGLLYLRKTDAKKELFGKRKSYFNKDLSDRELIA